ncbi:hypothetical protein [Butyrivibrio sp. NC3005]|uniref:hypothetical protein n=1 Tax=Butyrivibrio sp. NC3005 TaxID=1280685 RepID=UPI00040A167B|nr:hypothetical protein [Butyrivibrio sp. NC3005]
MSNVIKKLPIVHPPFETYQGASFILGIFPEQEWMTDKYGRGIQFLRDISRDAKEHSDNSVIEDVLKTVAIIKDYFANNMENFRSK